MENTHKSNPQETPNVAIRRLEERIDTLERQIAERTARAESEPDAEVPPPMQEALSAELERHRDELRDYEKALVERIADVDDDRRATASRLQRAWQTQREEIDDRLRRYAGVVTGLLILFAVLVAIALFLVYRQATLAQPQLVDDVAEVRQQLAGITAADGTGDQVREELARLSADVEEVATSVARLEQDGGAARSAVADERTAREEDEARAADEIRRLEAEQSHLAEELESLRAALKAVDSGRDDGQVGAEVGVSATRDDPRKAGPAMDAEPADDERDVVTVAPESRAGSTGDDDTVPAGSEPGQASAPQSPQGEDPAGAEQDAGFLGSGETHVAGEGTYALQLIGFYNRDSLARFVARDGLPPRVYYLRQTHKERPWYALVHSLHEGYAAAADELSRLPEDLVLLNPWIRPVPTGTELRVLQTGPENREAGD